MAPALSARARAAAPAVVRVGAGAGALLGVIAHVDGGVRVVGRDGRPAVCDAAALAACAARARRSRGARRHRGDRRARRRRARRGDRPSPMRCCARRWAPSGSPKGERLRAGASFDVGGAAGGGDPPAHRGRRWRATSRSSRWWPACGGRWARARWRRLTRRGGSIAPSPAIIAALVGVRLVSSWIAGRLAIDARPRPARAAAARRCWRWTPSRRARRASASSSGAWSRPRRWSRSRSAAG